MRIAIAHIGQETGSFTPTPTTIDTFRSFGLYEIDELLQKMHNIGPLGGFLAAAAEEKLDYTPLPVFHAWGGAHGTLTAETLLFLEERLISGLERVLPIDGFFFSQHGAAAAENDPDVEGYLLAAARRLLGPHIPIVSPLDHHANVTQRMIDLLDGLVAHQTQPHRPFETGKLAAHQLFAILHGEIKPTMAWRKIPMLAHQEQFLTSSGPMKRWFDQARAYEAQPGVINVSPFPMQPWLDVPEGGWATVVITNNDQALAERIADDHARMVWEMRDQFWVYESIPVEQAVRQAESAERGLVILSDTGDSVFGGAPGDSTQILRELLRQQVTQTALLPMVDAEVVEQAITAGVGATITVALGGKLATAFHQPVPVTAKVMRIGGGRIEAEVIGMESFDMGRAVLLEAGAIKIVVSEHEGIGGNHPIVYRHFGLEPATAKMVVMKTASNFQYYAEMTSTIIRVDTVGPTMSHLEQFPWQHVPRPIYPLDPAVTF
ncbi:MAG: M81 family metallopeptidase [Caldilineaceae bacterium]|nr:M81 family metallopeptidase [Caldilineaceae bacterium]